MPPSDAAQNGEPPAPQPEGHDNDNKVEGGNDPPSGPNKQSHTETEVPGPQIDQHSPSSDTPSSPGQLVPFDWDDFEARYEKALREADTHERETLKEAEHLSKYFQAWASAASAHDDERAVKRLRTRQRFVNLSEEKAAQKQQHYEEVVRAFESALALLQAK